MTVAPVLIGLTGPIGCGKSTVAGFLRDVGGVVIDADELAREATAPGSSALPAIRERFGDGVFARRRRARSSGAGAHRVRRSGRARATSSASCIRASGSWCEARLDVAARDRVPFVVIEAIKLVEGGLAERCDEVWIVDCGPRRNERA